MPPARLRLLGLACLPLACLCLAAAPLAAAQAGDEAALYATRLRPLLDERCASCHGAEKQKGKLRLDSPAAIMAGGKEGAVLVPGKPEASPLYTRTVLPADHDEVMPQKGDPLSKDDAEAIRRWIAAGAPFGAAGAQAGAATPPPAAKAPVVAPVAPDRLELAAAGLPAPDGAALSALAESGAVVRPLTRNRALLDIDLGHTREPLGDLHLKALQRLARHVAWLDLGGTAITDAQLRVVAGMPNLARLHLERTAIGDAGLAHLAGCRHLEYLNLFAAGKVGDAGLARLHGLASLERLYAWQTAATPGGLAALRRALPALRIEDAPPPAPAAPPTAAGERRRRQ